MSYLDGTVIEIKLEAAKSMQLSSVATCTYAQLFQFEIYYNVIKYVSEFQWMFIHAVKDNGRRHFTSDQHRVAILGHVSGYCRT